jgi:hypothetical protein
MGPNIAAQADPAEIARMMLVQKKLELGRKLSGGSSWFYWIAGLSLVNTIAYLTGSSFNFVMGLGLTQLVTGFAKGLSNNAADGNLASLILIAGIVLNVGVALVFALYGVLSRQRVRWVFLAGMLLYALDSLIFLFYAEWWALAFHLFCLVGLFGGLKALGQLEALEKQPVLPGTGMLYTQASAIGSVESQQQDLGPLVLKILAVLGTGMLVLLGLGAFYLLVIS